MICYECGIEAPTKMAKFHRNIGAMILRFHQSVSGQMCKKCIHKYFWQFTLINLFFGWWGVISFILTPFLVISNIIQYCSAFTLERASLHSSAPEFNKAVISKIHPYTHEIVERLENGGEFESMAQNIAVNAGVSPGQVVLYITGLRRGTINLNQIAS